MVNSLVHAIQTVDSAKCETAQDLWQFLHYSAKNRSDISLNFERVALVEETLSDGSKALSLLFQ